MARTIHAAITPTSRPAWRRWRAICCACASCRMPKRWHGRARTWRRGCMATATGHAVGRPGAGACPARGAEAAAGGAAPARRSAAGAVAARRRQSDDHRAGPRLATVLEEQRRFGAALAVPADELARTARPSATTMCSSPPARGTRRARPGPWSAQSGGTVPSCTRSRCAAGCIRRITGASTRRAGWLGAARLRAGASGRCRVDLRAAYDGLSPHRARRPGNSSSPAPASPSSMGSGGKPGQARLYRDAAP